MWPVNLIAKTKKTS